MTAPATARDEVPVFVPAGGADCFALLTLPTVAANGLVAVLLWGAGPYPSSGRNQLRARLARRLAAAGFHALRMDYRGVGESSGVAPAVRFDRPAAADVQAVCAWLAGQGLGRIVLVTYCFGTRKALAAADGIEDLRGVALISGPVRDEDRQQTKARDRSLLWYARQAASPRTLRRFVVNPRRRRKYLRWLGARLRGVARRRGSRRAPAGDASASPFFRRPLQRLVERGVPVLLAYGTADDFYPDFEQARHGALGGLLSAGGVTVRTITADHELQSSLGLQEAVIEVVEEWLQALAPTSDR